MGQGHLLFQVPGGSLLPPSGEERLQGRKSPPAGPRPGHPLAPKSRVPFVPPPYPIPAHPCSSLSRSSVCYLLPLLSLWTLPGLSQASSAHPC